MDLSVPNGAPKVGPKRSPPKGAPRSYKSKGKWVPKANPSLFSHVNSTLLQYVWTSWRCCACCTRKSHS